MECPNCYEIYDDKERIPRNLPCGHTYCEPCLSKIYQNKKRLECPVCRTEVDPVVKANHLSKNYVAIEVACKHLEVQKKLMFCPTHSEPLRFFCDTCQVNICPSCIIEHSGHKFVKQDHSAPLLKQRAKELKGKIEKKLTEINNSKTSNEQCRKNIIQSQNQQLKYIDEEFDRIIARFMKKKEAFKLSYKNMCQEEVSTLEKELGKVDALIQDQTKNIEEIDKYIEKIEKLKLIQGDEYHRELSDLEDKVNKDKIVGSKSFFSNTALLPKVIFDPLLYKEIKHVGITTKDLRNLRICFFGEKSKILIYSIEQNEWTLTHLSYSENYEFNYYSSAVTLPNGTIMITGGGVSHAAYQIYFSPTEPYRSHQQQVKMVARPSMHQSRKEHASVFLQDSVYVLGGYDGINNRFLDSCERFDLETNEWIPVEPMKIPKCAFGATTMANRYIFALGGYDGNNRLSTIEKYDSQNNTWVLLEVKLKQALSNSACFAYSDNSIVILGGGYNSGFCFETNQLNVSDNTWKQLPSMRDGRDLRNKIVSINGNVYAIGGNSCKAEKFSLKKEEWSLLASYKDYLDDNLDSWSCALYYETPRRLEEFQHLSTQNSMRNIPVQNQIGPNYGFRYYNNHNLDDYDNEEVLSDGGSIGTNEEWI